MKRDETLHGWIALHDKAWGAQTYEGRPTTLQMVSSPVVTFWYPQKHHDKRFTATFHATMRALDYYASLMLVEQKFKQPSRRLARLFVDGQRVRIRGVRFLVERLPQAGGKKEGGES